MRAELLERREKLMKLSEKIRHRQEEIAELNNVYLKELEGYNNIKRQFGFGPSCVKDEDVECDCGKKERKYDLDCAEDPDNEPVKWGMSGSGKVKFITNPEDFIFPYGNIKYVERNRKNETIVMYCNDGTEIHMIYSDDLWTDARNRM